MRSLSIALLLSISCILLVEGMPSVNFTGNVSLTGDQDSWNYRRSDMMTWDYSPLEGDGAWFESISVGGTKWSREGDAMWGEAAISTNYAPTAWLAYAEWGVYNNSNEMDVKGAKGYVANAYLELQECAPNGTVVKRQSLKESIWPTQMQWDTADKGVNGELKYIAFSGSVSGQPWKIVLTFIVSDVVGVVNMADAVVTPKSLESIVSITNWPYMNSANSLSLTMAVATGEVAEKGSILFSGSDASQVYFSLASKATVGTVKKDVTVSSFVTTNFSATFEDPDFEAQLNSVYGDKCQVKLVKVTFPAGASSILYDPTIGAGSAAASSDGQGNSSSSVVVNVVLLFIACVAVLLM